MDKKTQGRKNRKSGGEFERRVRKDLESEGWVVDRFTNTVKDDELVPCRNKWNNFTKSMMMGSGGFPDFIAFKFYKGYNGLKTYEIMGVECKVGKYLDKIEKQKCQWLLDNNVFSKILIAFKTKVKNRVIINYKEYGTS